MYLQSESDICASDILDVYLLILNRKENRIGPSFGRLQNLCQSARPLWCHSLYNAWVSEKSTWLCSIWREHRSHSFLTIPRVLLWYLLTKSWQYLWLECLELDTSAVCPVASYLVRQIWNTKTRALSFTISNNTYFIYTGTKLWTGDQCSGQTHFIYTFKNVLFLSS